MRIGMVAMAALLPVAAQAAERRATTANYDFRYTWPDAAARYPALRAWLDQDAARVRADIARQAATGRREARSGGFPFNRYEATKRWQVVTDTPRFLSLSADAYTFLGGAHGSPATRGLVWDKAARRRLDPVAVFASPAALSAAVRPAYCARLDQLRRARRGSATQPGSSFSDCPKLGDLTLLLGSTDRRRIDRIGLVADAGTAGSFAEGKYEVTLPVTPALRAAVKPAYRPAF